MKDSVLVNEWLPVLRSSELQDKPLSVQLLAEKIVVFRTTEGISAFKDLCIHRGVPLSMGKIVNDELICAYHGWAYNSCGACVRIPAQPPSQTIPAKAKAIVYSCMEQYGLIWVSLGQPAKALVEYHPYHSPEYKSVQCGPYSIKAAAPRIIENFLDVSHLMFIHEGFLGDSNYPEISDYRVTNVEGRVISDEIAVYQPNSDGRGMPATHYYTYEVLGPLTVLFTKRESTSDNKFTILLTVQPESEATSKAFMIISRNYDFNEPDEVFVTFQDKILFQDLPIVEAQQPELLPLDLQAELHLKSDRMSIAYRKLLSELNLSFGTA